MPNTKVFWLVPVPGQEFDEVVSFRDRGRAEALAMRTCAGVFVHVTVTPSGLRLRQALAPALCLVMPETVDGPWAGPN
jgi:hypothetical protein